MTHNFDRRLLLKTGMFGLGALALPGGALAALQASLAKGFSHGVASGEPSQNSVLLWTRYVSDAPETKLAAEVSEFADFRLVWSGAEAVASPLRDHTAKAVIKRLDPGKTYYYRFIAPDGSISPIGRTRTLPVEGIKHYRLAVFSCSNLPFGWFNAYAHAAKAGDFDLSLHLGDYLYEYQSGYYPGPKDMVAGRLIEPANEIVSLAEYRLRYASYRMDPDLQAVHARAPMLAMWDDHEIANDASESGAQNHQPKTEGEWSERKRAAEQAYREWMPVRDLSDNGDRWKNYPIGDLANIIMTESRITARSRQTGPGKLEGDFSAIAKKLTDFRDGALQDPARTMLGTAQEQWLHGTFASGKAKWNIWAQQTIMGSLFQPKGAENWLKPDADDIARQRVLRGAVAAQAGIPSNLDAWDGYPAARARALSAAQNAKGDLVVLTGDSHNAWAFDLSHDGKPAGVEFAGQSVTSSGLEAYFTGAKPKTVATALMQTNPGLKWTDSSQRGYMVVDLTPERATSEWRFVESVKARSTGLAGTKRLIAKRGKRQLQV
ncbi:MAG: alkaline phosphatase D family protein [Sphingorhabdus sp.]